jgi:dipeptidyl aminopeptidase/acylaminoacyl peptidase
MPMRGTGLVLVLIAATASVSAQPGAGAVDPSARREAFLKRIERPRVPLAPRITERSDGPVIREHFTYMSEQGQTVPGVLRKPRALRGRAPAVVLLHGTGGSKEDARIASLSDQLAGRGVIAVAIDGRYHGERAAAGARAAEYVNAMLRAYRTRQEYPFLYDTVWDVLRLVDYLETRDDVDPRRVGAIGISKGGMETYLAAAADPRIAVAVPVIGVQSFRWALENDAWRARVETFQRALDGAAADEGVTRVTADFVRRFYDRVVPGIYAEFDAAAMLPLIAPRPLLVINGDSDPRTPLPGVRESVAGAEARYRALNAADRFRLLLQPDTGHAFTPPAEQAAIEWLTRWLSVETAAH